MIVIKSIFLVVIGLCSGFAVAAGVFAFITMLGIVPRLVARTRTGKYVKWYETVIVLGGTTANIAYLFSLSIHLSVVGVCLFGLFSGVYVGCLAMALAEMLRVLPVLIKRGKLVVGLPILILFIGLGKLFGVIFQYFVMN